jgi:hypothetical protein
MLPVNRSYSSHSNSAKSSIVQGIFRAAKKPVIQ